MAKIVWVSLMLNQTKVSFLVTFYLAMLIGVEPSGVQALKNPNPLKDVEGLAVLAVAELS